MSLRGTIRTSIVATAALAVVAAPLSARAETLPIPPTTGALAVTFYTPSGGVTPTGASVHLLLGAPTGVDHVDVFYRPDSAVPAASDSTWQKLTTSLKRTARTGLFDTNATLAGNGTFDLEAVAYSSTNAVLGETFADNAVTVSGSGIRFDFTPTYNNVNGSSRNSVTNNRVGIYRRADGHTWAILGVRTTTGTSTTLTDPTWPATKPALRAAAPVGAVKDGVTYVPVDLAPTTPVPGIAVVRADSTVNGVAVSDAEPIGVYAQHPTSIRVQESTTTGSSRKFIATVRDEYNLPIAGVSVRLAGQATGAPNPRIVQAGVTGIDGTVSFTGPGSGTGPVAPASATGYADGGYLIWADTNLSSSRTSGEPAYQVLPHGRSAYVAPGKAFYHSDTRIKGAGGTLGDSLRGTKAARAHRYTWIDNNGQLAFSNKSARRGGAGKVRAASQVTWVNAHGAPFNPRWLKNGRFETRAWTGVRKHKGLRDALTTFRQNAAYGLSTEWEVKNIRPFNAPAALNAAFANLASAARAAYGASWQRRVQVKMLSNLTGGQNFALSVLKVAHAYGFTTILLARGANTRSQFPVAAHQYVDYVRGAVSNIYPANVKSPTSVLTPGTAPVWTTPTTPLI
ncbi:hypothetical protein [Nocardioides sp. Kera G14]|uniref:hypothetical protein n=1 Tax=Nocardioides sp. Kera G14 TaxID=2884264 RepID=UPI001D0F7573|nr:hypothetical protein [Nocardioides sp. Kera G14]UDY24444.1 hypothetical protein LH076_03840 [Nocardioides sp. Kera G14]